MSVSWNVQSLVHIAGELRSEQFARRYRSLRLVLLAAVLLLPGGAGAQTCLKDNGGCSPPEIPQQCFPGIIGGPWS